MFNGSQNTIEGTRKPNQLCTKLLQELAFIYVFLMLTVYPLYFRNKYYDIGNAKWQFFFFITVGAGTLMSALLLIHMIERASCHEVKNAIRNIRLSAVDWFISAYAIAVLISTLLSPYKEQIIWGYDGWYMGLVSQMCFVLIYFLVSRYWRWERSTVICCLTAAFLVFLLAVLMRFRIDPFALYQGLSEGQMTDFLSTIGQATWYSSYMVVLFPLGMFAFWFYDSKYIRILGGIFTSVGFMTMVTQNSDSAFIALSLLIFVLFWISMESNRKFKRFLEVMMMCFSCFKFIGICQRLFPEKLVPLDTISIFCSQSGLTWIALSGIVILYFGFRWLEKYKQIEISKIKNIRIIFLGLLFSCILGTVIYIYLNTTKQLPERFQSANHYLLFDKYWGNYRGVSWMIAVKSFLKGDFIRKVFGCGPDGFFSFTQSFFKEEMLMEWGDSLFLSCAHNEWLNAFVNLGVVGGVIYIGIFITAVRRFFGNSKEYPELTAIALSIICYMGHNFFCYQQIICTPIIFILMGVGESIIRYGKMEK